MAIRHGNRFDGKQMQKFKKFKINRILYLFFILNNSLIWEGKLHFFLANWPFIQYVTLQGGSQNVIPLIYAYIG